MPKQARIVFRFPHFINAGYGDQVARQYPKQFLAGYESQPYGAVALFLVGAGSGREAAGLEAAVDLRRLYQAYGHNATIPSVETAKAMQYTARDQAIIAQERPRSIIGTPERVAARVRELKESFVADEVLVLTVAASYRARLRSTQLLAEAFST